MIREPIFEADTGFLLIDINMDAYGYMREEVEYRGKTFKPKDELHVTILSKDAAEKVAQHIDENPEDRDTIDELIQSTDWSFRKTGELYFLQEDEDTETIIEMVEMAQLETFFQMLENMIGERLDVPPAHVTLYMRGTEKGIGLANQDEFDQYVVEEVIDIGE
jgi:hypothetical protein